MTQTLEPQEVLSTLQVGVGVNPIERDFVEQCGDADLWAELDELFYVRLASL